MTLTDVTFHVILTHNVGDFKDTANYILKLGMMEITESLKTGFIDCYFIE